MKFSDLTFKNIDTSGKKEEENWGTDPFTLTDGHKYIVHRLDREGKPPVYSLIGVYGAHGAVTPYIGETQIDRVLTYRSSEDGRVEPTTDPKAPTGYRCPGCGAVTTETGTHVSPPAASTGEASKLALNDQNQIELLPTKPAGSRFFDRS